MGQRSDCTDQGRPRSRQASGTAYRKGISDIHRTDRTDGAVLVPLASLCDRSHHRLYEGADDARHVRTDESGWRHAADDHRVRLRADSRRTAKTSLRGERWRLDPSNEAHRKIPRAPKMILGHAMRRKGPRAAQLAQTAPVFAALGDPVRLAIVSRLSADGPLPTIRLKQGTRVSRQAVTKHLRVLEDAGLVRSDRVGRDRLWQIEARQLAELRQYLDQISARWDLTLERLRSYVEDNATK